MSLGYKVVVRPIHEREHIVKNQLSSPLREETTYDVYENTPTRLRVIRLPLDVPIYRMDNGRTQSEQISYAVSHGLKPDYFSTNEESESAQQIQHELLIKFANEGSEGVTPIVDVLRRDKQREPLWIAPGGVVVNGNRRLAAMRELHFNSPKDYPEFGHVECAVLPPLTPDQVDEIEMRLQMSPETKLPYGWVNECLKIQRQLSRGKSEAHVAHVMRGEKPRDIKAAINALKEVDIYLHDWRKKPGEYRLVEKGKQFFYDLPVRLKGKNGDLLEASRRIGWILFDNSEELGRRIYDFNALFGIKAEEALANLAERTEIDLADPDSASSNEEKVDDLDINLGNEVQTSKYRTLIEAMEDPTKREEVRDELIVVCQTMIDASHTDRQGKTALFAVRDANTRLAEVDLTKADPKTYDGLSKQLDEIVRRASDLKTKLYTYKSGGKPQSKNGDNK